MSNICNIHNIEKNYHYKCIECHRSNSKEWYFKNEQLSKQKNIEYHKLNKDKIAIRKKNLYSQNKEKYKLMNRRSMLKTKYEISLEEYENMLKKQNNVCKICSKPETQQSNKKGGIDSLRVDHCHKTNNIRGLLCSKCNFGIGNFDDDIYLLKKAIDYLKN